MGDDEERNAWDRAWRAMPHHRLPSPPIFDVGGGLAERFGAVVAATISLVPPEYGELCSRRVAPESGTCPVCGHETSAPARRLAMLNAAFAGGFRCGFGVWVHRRCFETCPEAGGPAPIPW